MFTNGFKIVYDNKKYYLKLVSVDGLELEKPYTISSTTNSPNMYGSHTFDEKLIDSVASIFAYCERFVNKDIDDEFNNIREYAVWEHSDQYHGYIVIKDIKENRYRLFFFRKSFKKSRYTFLFEEIKRIKFKFGKSEFSEKLDKIASLEDNWNNKGSKSFSKELIEKCKTIIEYLSVEPFIAPTAHNSIQVEFDKPGVDYLEFQIYDNKVEVFSIISCEEKESVLSGDMDLIINQMQQIITDFYK